VGGTYIFDAHRGTKSISAKRGAYTSNSKSAFFLSVVACPFFVKKDMQWGKYAILFRSVSPLEKKKGAFPLFPPPLCDLRTFSCDFIFPFVLDEHKNVLKCFPV